MKHADPAGLRFRRPLNTPEFRGARPRRHERTVRDGMIIERDVEIPTRFGFPLFADVFRPDAGSPCPPLLAWTPYGKHDPAPLATIYPASGVKAEWMSDLTIFEAPDPVWWTARGYAVVTIDIPGLWHARSDATFISPQEAEAYADAIEWAAAQPWSNGRVGLSGVSYLTVMQWRVAELGPPGLKAINPWEGWTDTYREVVRHGGIPETHFWPYIQVRWGASDTRIEDLWAETAEHPMLDAFWESKAARLEAIRTPAWVVGSWSDHGLHTRGTLEGFRRMGSPDKWLEIHGRKKWAHYYDPESVARQKSFFDHYLAEAGPRPAWPAVRYEIRSKAGEAVSAQAPAWPVPEAEHRRFHLDARTGTLGTSAPEAEAMAEYDSLDEEGLATFDLPFDQRTDIIGHAWLRLTVSAEQADDLDLFAAIEKLDARGRRVGFMHYAVFEDGPVALGFLRASHRELDPDATTSFLPVLAHDREMKTEPGERIQVDIEILPSGTRFEKGETLRLVIKGRDIVTHPKPMLYIRHEDTVNHGLHRIHTGGGHQAWLQLPILTSSPGGVS